MSEEVLSNYFVIVLTVLTSLMGWIANTLAGLRKDLNKKVEKYDCDKNMTYHCTRLTKLEEDVSANTRDILVLKEHQKK